MTHNVSRLERLVQTNEDWVLQWRVGLARLQSVPPLIVEALPMLSALQALQAQVQDQGLALYTHGGKGLVFGVSTLGVKAQFAVETVALSDDCVVLRHARDLDDLIAMWRKAPDFRPGDYAAYRETWRKCLQHFEV